MDSLKPPTRVAGPHRGARLPAGSGAQRRSPGGQTNAQGADAPSPAATGARQRLRLRRFLFASGFSVLYALVLAIFHAVGRIGATTLAEACALVGAFVLLFFVLFGSGLNLRFRDPSLTVWQLAAAVATMLYVVYYAPDTRVAFAAFFFVALMFGMLRLSGSSLALVGACSVGMFAAVVGYRYAHDRDDATLELDLLQCAVMGVTFPWLLFIGEHVKRLKRDAREASLKLDDVEETARRDELTGLYNRRGLIAAMEDAKRRADASGEPLSICVIDLDRFKRFNDQLDHLAGDEVLRSFAGAARAGLRGNDVFGRYGGEEFVQILRHTTLAGAVGEAERLRARVSRLDLAPARRVGPLTISVGVAQYAPGEPIVQTFARADAALLRAKQRGRNRVEAS
jgi:diguanylate cyclase (GGDEF)-like protein